MRSYSLLASLFTLALSPVLTAQDAEGFVPMFNGKDLRGWRPVNVAADTFRWENDMVITTGFPTGFMATERMYENFIMELDWRHMKEAGNAGVFIWGQGLPAPGVPFARGIEVQVLDLGYEKNKGANEWFTSHGDIFPIWGATMTAMGRVAKGGHRSFPIENRVKPSPEWNHYRIECNNGEIRLAVNGKQVTAGKDCNPRKGYLCLESEGSECHFKNVRIKELPSSNPPAELTARGYEGFRRLFNGKDLGGWKVPAGEPVWSANGATFKAANAAGADKSLWSEKEFGDYVLCADFRIPSQKAYAADAVSGIYLRGRSSLLVEISVAQSGSGSLVSGEATLPAAGLETATPKSKADLPPGQWNRFFITVKGQHVTVELNEKVVIDKADLLRPPLTGSIGLHYLGGAIEFSNLFIKEL